jgi:hypothetical protein
MVQEILHLVPEAVDQMVDALLPGIARLLVLALAVFQRKPLDLARRWQRAAG